MLGIHPLRNPIQPYPWGSRTALAALRGEATSPGPEAELWIGSHPMAPSELEVDGDWRSLAEVIAERPAEVLGDDAAARGERALPFLLKVLAAAEPLSIQTHPDPRQAAAGCRREDVLGIPRDAPHRSYRDESAKPELLYALQPFVLVAGFRPPGEIFELFSTLGLGEAPGVAELRRGGARELAAFFTAWMTRTPAEVARWVAVAAGRADGRRDPLARDPVARWIGQLAHRFPGDRGVLAPAFLHLLELQPGEAVFTGPGVLHAYLEGAGVELMAASDNVLRGGLTTKHVDVLELLRVVSFESTPPVRLVPASPAPGVAVFASPDGALRLTRVRLEAGRPWSGGGGPRLLLATAGSGVVVEVDGERRVAFRRGDGLLVPASVSAFRLEGEGEVFVASAGAGSLASASVEAVTADAVAR